MSTPETTPFTVNAFRGNSATPIATFTISNASSGLYDLPNGNNNITLVDDTHTGTILTNSGLRFEAPSGNRFYVNYRGRSGSQAASLTSKGRSAMGKRFKWGGVPNLGTHISKSNTLGIMATEDNTTIDIFGYHPDCEFRVGSNRAGITADSYQIVLDAHESFVLETYIGNNATQAHEDGWIGTSIVSDKNIVISNGSLNYGRQAGSTNRDAGIDQPVPENRLGKEYVFVRGNGGTNGATEFPLIIGTQNNTEIYVNGSATPIATINNGDYFEIPSGFYSTNVVGANMFVRTTKDVYAYQCMAGSSNIYTQGLNFVAPVNCLMTDTMDNIPDIRDAAGITVSGGITVIASTATPDSNILVSDGAGSVALPPANVVAGSADWKTLYIPNLNGDVSVRSTGPIAVGFFGFNGARGIAGYYSGFDTAPDVNLQITGNYCLPGGTLEVSGGEVFDSYQWFGDGIPIPGAMSPTYTASVAGDYFLRVAKGPCTYDSNSIQVFYCNPDIVLNKSTADNSVNEGSLVTFTITVESLGYDPVTNLMITDLLPNGLNFVSASVSKGAFSYPYWNIGTMNRGDLESLTLVTTAKLINIYNASMTYTNTISNTQDQTDYNITLDRPTVNVQVNRIVPTAVISNRRITIRVNRN